MQVFALMCLLLVPVAVVAAAPGSDPITEIPQLEQRAMERWAKGDPEAFLELTADDVVYFDPFIPTQMNGLSELTKYYRSFAGKVHIDRFEFLNPRVEVSGDLAVYTFNFVSYQGTNETRWNTTEVYRRSGGKWKIVHTHWSLTQPKLVNPPTD